jgi:hypothetical protein
MASSSHRVLVRHGCTDAVIPVLTTILAEPHAIYYAKMPLQYLDGLIFRVHDSEVITICSLPPSIRKLLCGYFRHVQYSRFILHFWHAMPSPSFLLIASITSL